MPNEISVTLSKKYTLAGKLTDAITFRNPKLRDLIAIESINQDGAHGVTGLMMAQLSGATYPEIVEFDLADYAACERALRPLLRIVEQDG